MKQQLLQQCDCNWAIAQEGLSRPYGAGVGRTLCQSGNASDWRISCCAAAAAGSDARMNGCALPVVINSGSGNQGITVSVPVIAYVRSQNCSEEQLFRALAVSNLLAIHQKKYIGKLSAYCGAISAASAAGAAIAWLQGCSEQEVAWCLTNTLAIAGGILCDGAKASCAAKLPQDCKARGCLWIWCIRVTASPPGRAWWTPLPRPPFKTLAMWHGKVCVTRTG